MAGGKIYFSRHRGQGRFINHGQFLRNVNRKQWYDQQAAVSSLLYIMEGYICKLYFIITNPFLHEERLDRGQQERNTGGKIYEDRSTALLIRLFYADSASFQETMRRVAEISYKNSTAVCHRRHRYSADCPGEPTRQDLRCADPQRFKQNINGYGTADPRS